MVQNKHQNFKLDMQIIAFLYLANTKDWCCSVFAPMFHIDNKVTGLS